jgi:hypothetical protein
MHYTRHNHQIILQTAYGEFIRSRTWLCKESALDFLRSNLRSRLFVHATLLTLTIPCRLGGAVELVACEEFYKDEV